MICLQVCNSMYFSLFLFLTQHADYKLEACQLKFILLISDGLEHKGAQIAQLMHIN